MFETLPDYSAPLSKTERVLEAYYRHTKLFKLAAATMITLASVGSGVTIKHHMEQGERRDAAIVRIFNEQYINGCLKGTPYDPAEGATPPIVEDSPWGAAIVVLPADHNPEEELQMSFDAQLGTFTPIYDFSKAIVLQPPCDVQTARLA